MTIKLGKSDSGIKTTSVKNQMDEEESPNNSEQLSALQQAEKIHSEKLQALGVMSAGLAHEINNPLNYSLLGVELLKREGREMLASEFDSTIADVEDGLLRIKNIVQDLKVYSRKVPEENIDEEFLVADAAAAAIRIVSSNYQNIEISSTLDTPYRVRGDISSIIQVLINLIGNSADSINNKWKDRGGRIDILGKRRDGRYKIEVVDNGEGVSNEQIENMFTPFYTTKPTRSGTGLGMSICQALVERHGGKIKVESSMGAWTSVTFDLATVD